MEKEERIDEEEEQQGDEIDREQAIALPNREAMTIIAPPLISGIAKTTTSDPQAAGDLTGGASDPAMGTGQGINETVPGSET